MAKIALAAVGEQIGATLGFFLGGFPGMISGGLTGLSAGLAAGGLLFSVESVPLEADGSPAPGAPRKEEDHEPGDCRRDKV